MDKKIYWCEENGTVYWLEGDEVAFAPMNVGNTSNLDEGGIVETWEDCVITEAQVRAKLV